MPDLNYTKYSENVYHRSGKNLFWSTKKLRWVTNKLKSSSVRATNVSTFDVPTLFTTLHHYVIKEKLIYIIEKK